MAKKILILSSQAGGGHVAISNALKQYLTTPPHNHQVKILNTSFNLASTAYRIIGEYFIDFHQKNWQSGNTPQKALFLHQLNAPLIAPKIAKTILSFKPHLIIATNALSTYELKATFDLIDQIIPHLVVIADPFTIHHAWTTYKQANHYLAPTVEAKKILIKRGIQPYHITVTGLPLRLEVFSPPLNQSQAQQKFGLKPRKLTIFIGGSGEGHGQIYKLTKKLLSNSQTQSRCQLIVVAGKNKLLKTRLTTLSNKYPNLKPFGYTNLIDQLLTASDLIVGKPGPNILFESLMLQKPFIATSKPLSQELGNYHYISQQKLGFVTHQSERTFKVLADLIKNPHKLKLFQSGINKHRSTYQNTPQETLKIIHQYL